MAHWILSMSTSRTAENCGNETDSAPRERRLASRWTQCNRALHD